MAEGAGTAAGGGAGMAEGAGTAAGGGGGGGIRCGSGPSTAGNARGGGGGAMKRQFPAPCPPLPHNWHACRPFGHACFVCMHIGLPLTWRASW